LPATLAGSLDTSVDNFLANATTLTPNFPDGDDPFTFLVWSFDPSAFGCCGDGLPLGGGELPDNAIADFAVGLDYTLFATGIGGNDVGISDLLGVIQDIPAYIVGLPVLLALLFA